VAAETEDVVELTDAKAIRAIAHPARLVVIDAMYDRNRALTATQAAELAGTSPSAMSYHLRALERFGIVRRAPPTADGRERPWIRAAHDLRIRPPAPAASSAVALATNAVLSTALDVLRERLFRSLERGSDPEVSRLPLDDATGFSTTSVVVTPDEAMELLAAVRALIEPMRVEQRTAPPPDAERLTVMVASVPDPDPPPAKKRS
jgi:DNA-binding transcriptional ArsR family regulator